MNENEVDGAQNRECLHGHREWKRVHYKSGGRLVGGWVCVMRVAVIQ
jgi:hypothetical protein